MSSILIIGAGIFGTSTAYYLSKTHTTPSKITILDRTPYPPLPAASTDINKVVRTDYTSRFYMDLAYEAMRAWDEWPELQDDNGRFFHRTGWINLVEKGSDLADRIKKNFKDRGHDPTSTKSLDESLRKEWGGLLRETRFEGFGYAYWNPEAGWADAAAAVKKLMEMAVGRGVKYVCGEAESLVLGKSGVSGVKVKSGEVYEADSVLLCTGAWTSSLMTGLEDQLDIEEQDRTERQITAVGVCCAHFWLNETELDELKDMPVVIYGGKGEVIPPPTRKVHLKPDGYHILKYTNAHSFSNHVTTASGHQISVPKPDQHAVPDKLKQESWDIQISKSVPQYVKDKPVEWWRLCWDGITPDQNWLLTKHPDKRLGNLYFATGGSGHSWKFLPIAGTYVVNLLQGKSNGEDKDKAWEWKKGKSVGRGAHEKLVPKRDLKDLEDGE
jgi:sarcosine oxidase / L-pipecolate oxidase